MLDDLNNLPEIDCYPDKPYEEDCYELLADNVVIDGSGNLKNLVAIGNDRESIDRIVGGEYKIVHWSAVDGIMQSLPRFYGVGKYNKRETNSLWLECDKSWRGYVGGYEVGDLIWYREGIYAVLDIGLLPVIECRGGYEGWQRAKALKPK